MSAHASPDSGGGLDSSSGSERSSHDETATEHPVPRAGGSYATVPELAEEHEEFHDAADHFSFELGMVIGSEDDEDDGEYNDAFGFAETDDEEEEEEEEDDDDEDEEEEGDDEDEDEDEDEDGEENAFIDGGQTIAYLTRGQLNAFLQNQNQALHQVLLGVTGYDSDAESWGGYPKPRLEPGADRFPPIPNEKGQALMDSGIFGAVERESAYCPAPLGFDADGNTARIKVAARRRPVSLRLLDREIGYSNTQADRRLNTRMIAQSLVPSTAADMVVRYDGPVYLGQFSDDGNFFFSGTKDLHVRMYDTSNVNEWHHYKTVTHPTGRWTMTDASLSPDNRWLAFTSMMPQVCLAPTDPNDEGDPYLLDLSRPDGRAGAGHGGGLHDYGESFCIFSVRFSGDGRELVTGTNVNAIVVYDIESRTVLHHLVGHEDDVNAVCFGDKTSPHLLYSGSDDATIKVWDRRSLGDGRPAGAFVGHCEGITYIDSKGDGRYILSNSKDQTMRLWDLRMAMSTASFRDRDPTQHTRNSRYDYRFQRYDDERFFRHPDDNSVVTFRGHRVERTLLRCHFSPPGSSDSRYVYSASYSGKVYIWNLDATLAGVINVREATSKTFAAVAADEEQRLNAAAAASAGAAADSPAAAATASAASTSRRRQRLRQNQSQMVFNEPLCVRDASWHPSAPIIVASSFDVESMDNGFCSVHTCDLGRPGEAGDKQYGLFDERMKAMKSIPPRRPVMRWWA